MRFTLPLSSVYYKSHALWQAICELGDQSEQRAADIYLVSLWVFGFPNLQPVPFTTIIVFP